MNKRLPPITLIIVALLLSQSGGLLMAAFCTHLPPLQVSCHTEVAESAMPVHDIGDMATGSVHSMGSIDESDSNPDPNAAAVDQPGTRCPHCVVHSRTTPNALSLKDARTAKRSGSFSLPDSTPAVVSVEVSSGAVLTSRAHGPPGAGTPRYVLLNIFRI